MSHNTSSNNIAIQDFPADNVFVISIDDPANQTAVGATHTSYTLHVFSHQDGCVVNPCLHGGVCADQPAGLVLCACTGGFSGVLCGTAPSSSSAAPISASSGAVQSVSSTGVSLFNNSASAADETPSSGLSTGALVGIVVGGIAGVALIAYVVYSIRGPADVSVAFSSVPTSAS